MNACTPWCINTASPDDGTAHMCVGVGSEIVELTAEPGTLCDDGVVPAVAYVVPVRPDTVSTPLVSMVWNTETIPDVSVHLTPNEARRIAAALLEAADLINPDTQKRIA